jgi:ATP-dependent Lon protease
MPSDNKNRMSKKDLNRTKKREEIAKNKIRNQESSDDDESMYTDESEEEIDENEYRKFLKKIFPSKYLDKKIASGEKIKQIIEDTYDDYDDSDSEDEDYEPKQKSKSKHLTKQTTKKTDSEDDNEEQDRKLKKKKYLRSKHNKPVVSESETDEVEDEDNNKETHKAGKFNIIFTVGPKDVDDEDEDDDEDWETCSKTDTNTENEDDPISTDNDTEDEEKYTDNIKGTKCGRKVNEKDELLITKIKNVLELKTDEIVDDDEDFIKLLKDLQSKNKNNKLVNECLNVCEKKININKKKNEKKMKKEKDRNSRIFKKILRDKNTMNDFEFYDKLETAHQKKIIKELREINKITRIEKPYRLTLLESNIPVIFKAAAMKKISSLRYMEPGSGEFYKIKNWVDTFMRVPFGEYKTLPLSIEDGIDKCHDFMANAQRILDSAVYGLNDAKMQIMQLLGQLITNPSAIGSAIAIHGPPGTGKTSLVKEGISKILNRPFAFIALGGATDSSFLEGHGYTYEGSTWGKIVQILIDSKCMNPVIYFDELDKISDTPKGEEIAGILTHLTDTSQNTQFHDKYFAEIEFDLSKCMFIFSYNDETKVNPILKDRMYRIQTKGYSPKQKTSISNNYLLPKIREQVKFNAEDIIVPDQTLNYIIENYCNKEDGVRNLKRCLEIIYTKLNLYRLMRPDSNLFEHEMSLKVEFPFTVTKDIVDKLIKKTNEMDPSLYHLYV